MIKVHSPVVLVADLTAAQSDENLKGVEPPDLTVVLFADLVSAQNDRNLNELNRLMSLCKERGYDKRMPSELKYAKYVQVWTH